jgi:hypothetical protein
MWHYRAPVADMLHLMTRVLDAPASWSTMPAYDGRDTNTAREVLERAGKFAGDVLASTNGPGDLAGCTRTKDGARTSAQWFYAARFGVEWLLPQAATHWTRVRRSEAALPFIR